MQNGIEEAKGNVPVFVVQVKGDHIWTNRVVDRSGWIQKHSLKAKSTWFIDGLEMEVRKNKNQA